MADDGRPERGVETFTRFAFERETVVLRGDRDATGCVVHHRHVDAAVTEHHLVGAPAQSPAEDLVAEADAEQRDAGAQHLPGDLDDMVGHRRIARPVGQEHPVGFEVGDLLEGGPGGQHMAADAAPREVARGVGLDAEVDRRDGEPVGPSGSTM